MWVSGPIKVSAQLVLELVCSLAIRQPPVQQFDQLSFDCTQRPSKCTFVQLRCPFVCGSFGHSEKVYAQFELARQCGTQDIQRP